MEDQLFILRTSFSSISSRHSWLLPRSHPPVHATGCWGGWGGAGDQRGRQAMGARGSACVCLPSVGSSAGEGLTRRPAVRHLPMSWFYLSPTTSASPSHKPFQGSDPWFCNRPTQQSAPQRAAIRGHQGEKRPWGGVGWGGREWVALLQGLYKRIGCDSREIAGFRRYPVMSPSNSGLLRSGHMPVVVSKLIKGVCRESADRRNYELELTINSPLIEVHRHPQKAVVF